MVGRFVDGNPFPLVLIPRRLALPAPANERLGLV